MKFLLITMHGMILWTAKSEVSLFGNDVNFYAIFLSFRVEGALWDEE